MATNPMQRKTRNSILLGVLLGLVIGSIFIALLFMQIMNLKKEQQAIKAAERTVYVVNKDLKSGTPITKEDLTLVQATKDVVPTDYIGENDITEYTIAKVDITQGTVISKGLINESTQKTTADLREQQYNMIVLPQYLEVNDYIDIRLTLANGQDFIVVSKKRIKEITEDTIWIDLYEEETVTMTNAIVEAYKQRGAKLYAATYVDPGNQANAIPTYMPNPEVINLINADKNIADEARRGLAERYAGLREVRENINNQLNIYAEEAKSNLESNIEQEITKAKENRKEYLDALEASQTVDSTN